VNRLAEEGADPRSAGRRDAAVIRKLNAVRSGADLERARTASVPSFTLLVCVLPVLNVRKENDPFGFIDDVKDAVITDAEAVHSVIGTLELLDVRPAER